MRISGEAKLSTFLALLGIGGAGALFVFPQPFANYVGWLLIGVALTGFVWLACFYWRLRPWLTAALVVATAVATGVAAWRLSAPKPEQWTAHDFKLVFSCPKLRGDDLTGPSISEQLKEAQEYASAISPAFDQQVYFTQIPRGFRMTIIPKPGGISQYESAKQVVFEVRDATDHLLVDVIPTFLLPTGSDPVQPPDPNDPEFAADVMPGMTQDVEGLTGSKKGSCKLQ